MVKNVNTITIGETTYNDKSVLTSVNLKNVPWSNNSMDSAFWNCTNLTSVTNINENVTNLSGTFSQCESLVDAPVLPNNVTDMWRTFGGCTNLVNAPEIPNSVTSLWSAFEGCYNLVNGPVVIPNSVTSMGWTYSYCTNLSYAPDFSNCNGLDNISRAFQGCEKINSVCNIPNSVTNMEGTFMGCYNLVTIGSLSNSVKNLDSTFDCCGNLTTNVTIPETAGSLHMTFSYCNSLTMAPEIPNSVFSLHQTFTDCYNLVNIPEIGKSVEDMYETFKNCTNLVGDINIYSNRIVNAVNCFYNTSEIKNIYIPFNYTKNTNVIYKALVNTDANKLWYITSNIPSESGRTKILYDENRNLVTDGGWYEQFYDYGLVYYLNQEYGWYDSYVVYPNNALDYIETHNAGEPTLTYNSFVNAGYDTVNRVDGVLLKELEIIPEFEPGEYTADSGLTENDYVYSNFANTTGIQVPSTYDIIGNEIVVKFRLTKDKDSEAYGDKFLFGQDSLDLYIADGDIIKFYTRNGPITVLTPERNVWYWIKVVILGSNSIEILTSEDNENWTSLGAQSYWGTITNRPIVMGAMNASSTERPFPGEIDMSGFRVYDSNGILIWGDDPNEPTFPTLGDRVDGKATIVGVFKDESYKRYALAVVDAQYRSDSPMAWSVNQIDTVLNTDNYVDNAYADRCSGKYNTDLILNTYTASDYPAFNFARNACTVTVNGNTYYSVLPNLTEIKAIYDNRVALDTYDPTLTSYNARSLTSFTFGGSIGAWSSNERYEYSAWILYINNSGADSYSKINNGVLGVCPVIIIPIDEF